MISVKVTGILEVMASRLNPSKIITAAKYALTDTKSQSLTQAGTLINRRYNISKKDLLNKASGKDRIYASGKVNDDLTASITFMAGGISLAYFGATEYRFKGKTLVRVNRKGGQAMKRLGKNAIGTQVQIARGKTTKLKQFFAAVKYGKGSAQGYHIGVFRVDPKGGKYKNGHRKIIESLSVSPATWVQKPEVQKPLTDFIQLKFSERFSHHLKRLGVTE